MTPAFDPSSGRISGARLVRHVREVAGVEAHVLLVHPSNLGVAQLLSLTRSHAHGAPPAEVRRLRDLPPEELLDQEDLIEAWEAARATGTFLPRTAAMDPRRVDVFVLRRPLLLRIVRGCLGPAAEERAASAIAEAGAPRYVEVTILETELEIAELPLEEKSPSSG